MTPIRLGGSGGGFRPGGTKPVAYVKPEVGEVRQQRGAGLVKVKEKGIKYAIVVDEPSGHNRRMILYQDLLPVQAAPVAPTTEKPAARPDMDALDKEFLA